MLWRRFLSLKNFADKIYGIKRDFYDKIKNVVIVFTSAPKRLYGRILKATNPMRLLLKNCLSYRISRR
jgi:L-fucose mutarotase/ribose pyranase (RbsD/FucU family)